MLVSMKEVKLECDSITALGAARSAGGEQQHGGCVGRRLRERRLFRLAVRHELLESAPSRLRAAFRREQRDGLRVAPQPVDKRDVPLASDDSLRSGVPQRVAYLVAAPTEVQRRVDGVQPCGGEVRLEMHRRVDVDDAYAVAGADAVRRQRVREPVGAVRQLRVGNRPVIEDQRRTVGDDCRRYGEDVVGMQDVASKPHYSLLPRL